MKGALRCAIPENQKMPKNLEKSENTFALKMSENPRKPDRRKMPENQEKSENAFTLKMPQYPGNPVERKMPVDPEKSENMLIKPPTAFHLVDSFMESTSAHGFPHIANAGNKAKKMSWFLVCLGTQPHEASCGK